MARSISLIQQSIIDQKNSYTELSGLTSTSQVSYWRLWTFIQAVSINLLEQIVDIFKTDIESSIINKVAGTKEWIINNSKLFQYSSTVPQIITIDPITYALSYPTLNTNLQIISQVSVSVASNNNVIIKVAKNTPPEFLNSTELNAFQSYMNNIMPAGIYTTTESYSPDQIIISATTFYDGAYSVTIQQSVKDTINNYLYSLPFGGRFVVSELESAILDIVGVKDVNITKITARRNSQGLNNTLIYQLMGLNTDANNRYYDTFAGYIIPETTTNYTLNDTLTYAIQ